MLQNEVVGQLASLPHAAHVVPAQYPLMQSLGTLHVPPLPHGWQVGPPQSMPVSSPSIMRSVQLGATHTNASFIVLQTMAAAAHCALEMQATHMPAFVPEPQTAPPLVAQVVPAGRGTVVFVPPTHVSDVQSLPSSSGSSASIDVVEPAPSQTIDLQSPAVWAFVGVEAATAAVSHLPRLHAGV
jgi:hypothetical protein